jgi:hypothetical protein
MADHSRNDPRFAHLFRDRDEVLALFGQLVAILGSVRDNMATSRFGLSIPRIEINYSSRELAFDEGQILRNLNNLSDYLGAAVSGLKSYKTGSSVSLSEKSRSDAVQTVEMMLLVVERSRAWLEGRSEADPAGVSIPSQKPAPIRLREDPRGFYLSRDSSADGTLEIETVSSLRFAAGDLLRQATSGLSDNIDQRFIKACGALRRNLTADDKKFSAVATGISKEVVGDSLHLFVEQLPEVTTLQIQKAIGATEKLLTQLPDWRTYKAIDSGTGLSSDAATELLKVVESIASDMDERCDLADQEIPARLHDLTLPGISNLVNGDSLATPAIASISNIMANAGRIVIDNAHILSPLVNASASYAGDKASYYFVAFCFYMINKYADRLATIPALQFVRATRDHVRRRFPWLPN